MLQTVFLTILNMSITASIVILIVLLARIFLKRAPKIFSYVLWAVVLFRLLCSISLTSGISLFNLLNAPARDTGSIGFMEYVPSPVERATTTMPAVSASNEQVPTSPLPAPAASTQRTDSLALSVAIIVWLKGMAALLLFHSIQLIKLRRKLVGAIPLQENIYLADHIPTPFVIGLIRPKIYLPSALPEVERPYIIQHEQHHIRRHDPAIKLLAFFALCIHWFNPLVWLSFALASRDMEMSCDEAVLQRIGREIRADYSFSLLRFSTAGKRMIGTPLAFGEGETKERIENIMKYKKPTVFAVVLAVLVCISLSACLFSNPQSDAVQPGSDVPTADDSNAEATPPAQTTVFTGFLLAVDPDADRIYVKTKSKFGFPLADTVIIDVPSDFQAAQQERGTEIRITYCGEPEMIVPDAENGYAEHMAILHADQILSIQNTLVLREDCSGTISKMVSFNDPYAAIVTLEFTYEPSEVGPKVCDIVDARAENMDGWVSVQTEIEIDTQSILSSKNDMAAVVPFTYYASIGEGLDEYRDVISIDLSSLAPPL